MAHRVFAGSSPALSTKFMLTEEVIKQFEDVREAYWKEIGTWWDRYEEIQKREHIRRDEFIKEHNLSLLDSIEQQIADWRWKQKELK